MNATIKKNLIAILLLAVSLVVGCATNAKGRSQLMLVSNESMLQMGASSYTQVLKQAKSKAMLDNNAERVARVKRISNAIVAVAVVAKPDSARWAWEVNVINDPNIINATCLPGGKMIVYTGIIEKMQLTDDELAAIMGHEVSHALLNHGAEKVSQGMLVKFGIGAAQVFGGAGQLSSAMLEQGGELLITLPNSRQAESEADEFGLELAAKAGFNPMGGVTLWQKMSKLGGKPAEFLSTHPSDSKRIAQNEATAQKLMPIYLARHANPTEKK